MSLTRWGFIYTAPGLPVEGHEHVVDNGQCTTILVGVPGPEYGIDVARRLAADGVQLIELCGGFGPVWTGRVIEALEGAVAVGSVGYGAEAITQVHAIFS